MKDFSSSTELLAPLERETSPSTGIHRAARKRLALLRRFFASRCFLAALLFSAIGATLHFLLSTFELEAKVSRKLYGKIGTLDLPFDRALADDWLGVICTLTALGLLGWLWLRRTTWAQRYPKALRRSSLSVLVLLTIVSNLSFFYGARGIAAPLYVKTWDSYHYFLGPKYYSELGYFDLYRCTVQADAESSRVLSRKAKIRDLRDYSRTESVQTLLAGTKCKEQFSQERWDSFKRDVELYAKLARGKFFGKMLRDHGYNGTPFHALVSGTIANQTGTPNYASLVSLSQIDSFLLLSMMWLMVVAFGWPLGLLFSIFFATSFTDRFYFIGGSFVRYSWMIALGYGIAALRLGRERWAGFLIAAAGMLNVFPGLFLLGIPIKISWDWFRRKRISQKHRRFLMGALLGVALCGGAGAAHGQGLENYRDFVTNMEAHTELLTRSRIGFRYNFLYRDEVFSDDKSYPVKKKVKEYNTWKPFIYGLALGFLSLLVLVVRRLNDVQATIFVGFSTFFFLFGTVEYYYGIYALMILLWSGRGGGARTRSGKHWMLLLPFALMCLTYFAWHRTRFLLFCNNTIMSATLTLYLSLVLIYFARTQELFRLPRLEGYLLESWDRVNRVITSRLFLGSSLVVLFALGLAFLIERRPLAPLEGPRIAFAGDVGLGRRLNPNIARSGASRPLKKVSELSAADLSIVNLECVVANSGDAGFEKGEPGSYYFRSRPENLEALRLAGINIVTTANNHVGDYGHDALLEQAHHLETMGFAHAGSGKDFDDACAPTTRRVGDLNVGVFSVDATMKYFAAKQDSPGTCHLSLEDPDKWSEVLEPRIAQLRKSVDVVLVAVHWGPNLLTSPQKWVRRAAHRIVEAGADAILGTSAHRLQGIEIYQDRPIVYDAGNLLFDFTLDRGGDDSAVFSLVLAKKGVLQLQVRPLRVQPYQTRDAKSKDAFRILEVLNERSRRFGTSLVPYVKGRDAPIGLLNLYPPRRAAAAPTLPAPVPKVGAAPDPPSEAPPQCVVSEIPEEAEIDEERNFGPLRLVGLHVPDKLVKSRQLFWVDSYWTIDEAVDDDFWLDLSGVPHRRGAGHWRGDHEPCDWAWPTSRWEPGVIYRDRFGIRPPNRLKNTKVSLKLSVQNSARKRVGKMWKAMSFKVRLPKNK